MKWFRPILLLFALALPCSAADPLPPAEAAQSELRQSEDHASPYFWAAFTRTGQWR